MHQNGVSDGGKISLSRGKGRELTASVAYALWEDRKRRNLPDDQETDWFRAEELIAELYVIEDDFESSQPQNGNGGSSECRHHDEKCRDHDE
jgi:hypothetical protein